MVEPYDHFRVDEGAPLPAGVYRVVGLGDDRVTLLRVGDAAGRRVHTGHVERVPRADVETFERTDSPDPTGPRAALSGVVGGLVLTARLAPSRAAARPLQTAAGVASLLVAYAGPAVAAGLPGYVLTGAEVLGVLLLAAVLAGLPRGR